MTAPAPGDPARTDEPFRVEVMIAAPADAVWRALRDKDQILSWHGWEVDGLEAEVDMIFLTNAIESPDERKVVVNAGDTFEIHEVGDRSVLRMTRAPRDPSNDWDQWYDDINEGWTTFMHQLQFALERHPGERRRTIYLDGARDTDLDPTAELGLAGAATGAPGTTYAADVIDEPLTGEVLFTAAHQVGLTVAQWGDGLLVLGVAAPAPHRPQGGAMALLTTYGLSDQRFAEVEARWTAWWRARYTAPPPPDPHEVRHTEPAAQPVQ